jgi:DNA processing protein
MDDLESLIRLNLSGMVGSALLRRLCEQFELTRIQRLSRAERERVEGIGPLTSKAIVEAGDPAREIELAERHGIRILPCNGPDYPPALRTLYDHPILLYRRGETGDDDTLALGIVGSRECTEYGRRQAARFGQELARLRISVVSGLARGTDTAAHRRALKAPKGRTIAFLRSGLRRVYPPENARLLDEISERGAAFSEFPLESAPQTANFPHRNRLISGLSLGVLVVEAAERSGALITADWALEQAATSSASPGRSRAPSRAAATASSSSAPSSSIARTLSGRPVDAESIAAGTRLPASCVGRALRALVAKGVAAGDAEERYRLAPAAATTRSGS